jgi:predicted O-methyltransferase YrrM
MLINRVIQKVGGGVQAIADVARMRPTSTDQGAYFGEFLQTLKSQLSERGSELGLGLSLFSLLVSIRGEKAIEIGRFRGFSTFALASALRFCDWGWEEPREHQQRAEVDYARLHAGRSRKLYSIDVGATPQAEALIEKNNLSPYVEYLTGDSRVIKLDVVADLLFIDGDHSYEGCRSDVDRFVPHNLRPGGYFILHDYFGYFQGDKNASPVKMVCDELVAEEKYQQVLIDTNYMSFMIFRKPSH